MSAFLCRTIFDIQMQTLPYIPRKRIDGSLDYYRALLRTIQRKRFIDEHILGISKEKFNAYIEELESAGYIKKWSQMQAYRDIF